MERTPSPPRRLHTPPAPLHGANFDSYEPYSPPRRSSRISRVAAQRQQVLSPTRTRPSRFTRDSTPPSSKRSKLARTSLQGLSPPSSPLSPEQPRSPHSARTAHLEHESEESDNHIPAPTPARRFLAASDPRNMLPSPSRTPRKRPLGPEETAGSTARVLFPSRPATVEDAMPTPRKGRKAPKYTLASFEEAEQEADAIPIYTDSKDRIPSGADEDNPFIVKRGKGKSKAKATSAIKRRLDPEIAKMEAAAAREEGIIYTFRGKKIFRKFQDRPSALGDARDSSGDEVRRQAGSVAHRPLTRSSVKPRLLFQEEIKKREKALHPHDTDEEAVTDIEIPIATQSGPKSRKINETNDVAGHQEETPPPTVRTTRQISFNSWTRVKSATRESSSSSRELRKRSGDALTSSSEKRPRREPSSPMTLD